MSCAYDRKSFLEAFGGWEWRADRGDVTFMTEHSKDLDKIAIVGMRSGRTTLSLLPPKGFVTAIEFFTPSRLEQGPG